MAEWWLSVKLEGTSRSQGLFSLSRAQPALFPACFSLAERAGDSQEVAAESLRMGRDLVFSPAWDGLAFADFSPAPAARKC